MSSVCGFLFPSMAADLSWGLALIAVALLVIYPVQLDLDDRRDIRAQAAEADVEAIAVSTGVLATSPVPAQREGGAR
jgi:hypothetical protein